VATGLVLGPGFRIDNAKRLFQYWQQCLTTNNYKINNARHHASNRGKNMPLVKWSPFMEPFNFDKFFDDFQKGSTAGFSPAIDMYEKGNNVIVEAQLPGIDAEKVDISVEDDVLTIQGKMEKKSEVEEENYFRREIHKGSFYRSVLLPAHVEGDKAQAEFEEGLLKVIIPKVRKSAAKKIKVQAKKTSK